MVRHGQRSPRAKGHQRDRVKLVATLAASFAAGAIYDQLLPGAIQSSARRRQQMTTSGDYTTTVEMPLRSEPAAGEKEKGKQPSDALQQGLPHLT